MTKLQRHAIGHAIALASLFVLTVSAHSRPTYFNELTSTYGITPSDRLYACGVCHYRWTGTGARNLFGTAVEQQLYLGKTINQSLQDVEGLDSDGDGFANVDEILTYMTLPGYSCANFFDAIDAPSDYHTYITPMVASCLEPLDIRVSPLQVAILTEVNEIGTAHVEVFNNGSDFPLTINSYGLLAGAHATLSVGGPAAPLSIPVGQSITIDVTFMPTSVVIASGTLRIASDDPDEGTLDIPINAISFTQVLAAPTLRAACLRKVERAMRRYGKTHMREYGRCYVDEVNGLACDAGARDLKIQQAAARFHANVGGNQDQLCAGAGLTPSLLGMPPTCGGGCGAINLTSMTALVDCLECRQSEATGAMLGAAVGTTPPDLPLNTAGSTAAGVCQKKLLGGIQKGIDKIEKMLGRCEVDNITAATPVECASALAADIATAQAKVDARLNACNDTAGLLGCLFETPDPTCLGDAALAIGADVIDAVFGLE
jgi:hypothetical protein